MNRYRDITCPKCGGKGHIDFVYPLGWAVRMVNSFDIINNEVAFDDDGKYETVDMTRDNTPFGDCPDAFFVHHNESGGECHTWRESEEIERQSDFEVRVFQVLRRVYGDWKVAAQIAKRHSELIKTCESEGANSGKAAMLVVAEEAGVQL